MGSKFPSNWPSPTQPMRTPKLLISNTGPFGGVLGHFVSQIVKSQQTLSLLSHPCRNPSLYLPHFLLRSISSLDRSARFRPPQVTALLRDAHRSLASSVPPFPHYQSAGNGVDLAKPESDILYFFGSFFFHLKSIYFLGSLIYLIFVFTGEGEKKGVSDVFPGGS